ncbi:hypothetical protein ACFQBY_09450 [Promicromonospora citrea]|uniref:Uncharacterized protein n=1 Tax=Promicromonospora citrea TaxID=43677 RepID=A0A8H9L357_9MICO|nr:hypothetical protein [Promicromonospora citrea]NNH54945.1 hypothetical protein [Promicromonospora citrea]GGM10557.1 hypothetical protein GCM10010102_02990 [Promicromonospora citrea]
MSLWGPAAEAEIEYRQAELARAWGGRRAARTERSARRAARRTAPVRTERARAQQIKEGIAGMRPAGAHRGLFA